MSGRYELLVADPAFGGTIAMLACPGPAPRTMLDVSRAPRVVADWLLTELNALLDRAEKAEARVAELERAPRGVSGVDMPREVLPVQNIENMVDTLIAYAYSTPPSPSAIDGEKDAILYAYGNALRYIAELERDVPITARCPHCGTLNEAPTARWEAGFVCGCGRRIAKTAPQTPVPAPEGTETAQKAPPPSPAGAPRSDRAPDSAGQVENHGPVLGHSRGSESSNLDTPIPRPSRMPLGIVEAWQDGDRVFGTYAGGPQVELVPVPPDDGPVRTFVVKDPVSDAFRVYDEMLRNPGHPQRGLTPEEVDLTKPQTLRAWATFGEASPENSIRILVDPAAAAEVEARTGAYVTRSAGVVTVTAIDGVIVEVRHPRAGLPSRDEVAAFLEGRWPK